MKFWMLLSEALQASGCFSLKLYRPLDASLCSSTGLWMLLSVALQASGCFSLKLYRPLDASL